MNIFVFDEDPFTSALWLDDVRQNKMILETAQLLSTAIHENDQETGLVIYRPTHKHHPCTKWVALSRGNFSWALDYLKHLGSIRNKRHKSLSLLSCFEEYKNSGYFSQEDQTPFANCARNQSQGVDFTGTKDTLEAYRKYIAERWKRDTIRVSWKYGEKPKWLEV
jgi:hypothetical protein